MPQPPILRIPFEFHRRMPPGAALALLAAAWALLPATATASGCDPFEAEVLPIVDGGSRIWGQLDMAFGPGGELHILGHVTGPGTNLWLARESGAGWQTADTGIYAGTREVLELVVEANGRAVALLSGGPFDFHLAREQPDASWTVEAISLPDGANPYGADIEPRRSGGSSILALGLDGALYVGGPADGGAWERIPLPEMHGPILRAGQSLWELPGGERVVAVAGRRTLQVAVESSSGWSLTQAWGRRYSSDPPSYAVVGEEQGRPRLVFWRPYGGIEEQVWTGERWERHALPMGQLYGHELEIASGDAGQLLVLHSREFEDGSMLPRADVMAVIGGVLGRHRSSSSAPKGQLVVGPGGRSAAIRHDRYNGGPGALLRLATRYWQAAPPVPNFEFDPQEAVALRPIDVQWDSPASLVRSDGLSHGYDCETGALADHLFFDDDQAWQPWAANMAGEASGAPAVLPVRSFELLEYWASAAVIAPGDAVGLSWRVHGIAEAYLDGEGPLPLVGSRFVSPSQSRDYELRIVREGTGEEETHSLHVQVFQPGDREISLSWDGVSFPGQEPTLRDGEPFEVKLFASGVDEGIAAWEAGLDLPDGVELLHVGLGGENPLNIAAGPEFIVGTGNCVDTRVLARMATITLVSDDVSQLVGQWIRLRGSQPSSLGGLPGYASCDDQLVGLPVNKVLLVGTELMITGGMVPVLDLALEAERGRDGLELRWELPAQGLRSVELHGSGGAAGASAALAAWYTAPWPTGWRGPDRGYSHLELRVELDDGQRLVEEFPLPAPPHRDTRTGIATVAPNPFNPSTRIQVELAQAGPAQLRIVDLAGRTVRWLHRGPLPAGPHEVAWDGRDGSGRIVASGSYQVELRASGRVDRRAVLLLK